MKILKIVLISLTILTNTVCAQDKDDKRFCFEPIAGTFIPKLKITTQENISLTNKEHYGYKFGFLKNIGIGQVFVVRPAITVSAFKRESYITNLTDNSTPILYNDVLDVHTQASLHISQNFSTGRARTFLYLVQGATFDYNLRNREIDQDLWLEDNQNITIDLGIGTRVYANRKHLFAVELLYSFGIRNMKQTGINIGSQDINPIQAQDYINKTNDIRLHYITLQFLL
jgi:hypothetical protein